MNLRKILESYDTIESTNWFKYACSEAIAHYKNGGARLYRGSNKTTGKPVLINPETKKRPLNRSVMDFHTHMINSGALARVPSREIIMVTSEKLAAKHGEVSLALPMDQATFGCAGASDIMDSFPRLPAGNLRNFYESVSRMLDAMLIASGRDEDVPVIHSLDDLRACLERTKDKDFSLPEIARIARYSRLPIELVERTLKDKSSKPIAHLFVENTITRETLSSLQPNMEYWTATPTVFIPLEGNESLIQKILK